MKSLLQSAFHGLHQQRIINPAAGAFFLRILGAALQFAFTIILARLYGASGVGVFIIALSILVITSTIVRWGLDQTALKLVATNLHSEHYNNIQVTVSYARNFILLAGIAGTAITMLLSEWLAEIFFARNEMAQVIVIMSGAIIPLSLTTLYAEALRGLKKITAYTLLHGVMIPLLCICFVLLLQHFSEGVVSSAAAYLAASLVVMLTAIISWRHFTADFRSAEDNRTVTRHEIFTTANSMAWIAIIGVAMTFIETFILGLFHTDVSVGLYAAALRLALIINFIIIAFNSILAPHFASLYQQGKLLEIQGMARQSVLVMLLITMPVVVIFVFLPAPVLSVFGSEFKQATTALVILSLGQLINVASGPVGILLQMSGQEKQFRNNVVFSAGITLVSALVLIPPYEVTGASVSAVIGILTLNTLSLFSVHSKLGINLLPVGLSSIFLRPKS